MKSSCLLGFCLFNTDGWTIRCPRLWEVSEAAFRTESERGCAMNVVSYRSRSRDIFTFLDKIIHTCKLIFLFLLSFPQTVIN